MEEILKQASAQRHRGAVLFMELLLLNNQIVKYCNGHNQWKVISNDRRKHGDDDDDDGNAKTLRQQPHDIVTTGN